MDLEVEVKLKGHRSFRKFDDHPAFRLRFDHEDKSQRFHGLRALVLNNMVDDPTQVRESLGYALYRAAGVAAPHTVYVQLSVNGEYFGLYLGVEAVDQEFTSRRFGRSDVGLYSGEYGCDLYQGDIAEFPRKRGPKESRDELALLARTIEEGRAFEPETPLDWGRVVSFLAVSTFIGDFDGYWHSHNYYLHNGSFGRKWALTPWGIDRVFDRKLDIFGSHGRLAELCFGNEDCRLQYVKRLLEVATLSESLDLSGEAAGLFGLLDSELVKNKPQQKLDEAAVESERLALRSFIIERPIEIRDALRCLKSGHEVDIDGDGYACSDCNHNDPAIHPGAAEICDSIDNDCNGLVDDAANCACERVQVGGTEFQLCKQRMSWADAKAACQENNMSLARLSSRRQVQAIFEKTKELDARRWWIGASDLGNEGTFLWTDGSNLSWAHWSPGQPNNSDCGQDCLTMDKGGRWADAHCETHLPFVCSKSL